MKTYHSFSSEETQALGERMALDLLRTKKDKKGAGQQSGELGGSVIALQGDLGAGKTTFVQGFFKGLGLKKRAQSPTFIIMRRHGLPKDRNVFHIDAYRLKDAKHMEALDFKKIIDDSQNVILIEWPERIKKLLPKNTTWITFHHSKKENERKIVVRVRR